jgi:hypothetical protein
MFHAKFRWPATTLLLPVLLVLFHLDFAEANDLNNELQQRIVLQSAEIDLIQAQLEIENWKHVQLEDLHSQGFASWLEVRKHQLAVDSIASRLKTSREFQAFLSDVKAEKQSAGDLQSSLFVERDSKPIKVYLPGSIRLSGWIEGKTLAESIPALTNEAEITTAQEKLAKSQKRFDVISELPSSSPSLLENASLRLNLARQTLKHAKALSALSVFQVSPTETAPKSISIDEIENFVTAEQSHELKIATLMVANAEAAASGHINSAQIMLAREQRRADAFRDLQSQGHASIKEVNIVTDRVTKIKSQLEAYTKNRKTLGASLAGVSDADELTAVARYESVSSWPAVVVGDPEFAFHLIDLRREFYNEKSLAEMYRLKSAFLEEVLVRLKDAATITDANGKPDSYLKKGQRNEIETYESDIEFSQANRLASIEKQQILVREETRFRHQALAQHDAARNKIVSTNKLEFSPFGMATLLNPTGAIAFSGTSKSPTHFSYLESGNLNSWGRTSLLYSQFNLNYVGSPSSLNSDNRFGLLPVHSSLLTSDSRRSYSSARGLQVEPDWMNYFRPNLARNSASPYQFPELWTNPNRQFRSHSGSGCFGYQYGRYNYQYRYPTKAYLREFCRPGQVPWYIPGAPSSFRSNRLYEVHYGPSYYRW